MLTHRETLELIRQAQSGDQDAKEKLIEQNMPLIKSIVKRYLSKYVDYEDLMQLGALGLIKAINNFDLSFDVRFSTYAVPMIGGEIKRFLRDDGSIKVSRTLKNTCYKINRYIEEYRSEHDREPDIGEIASHFGIEPEEVAFTMDSSRMPVSIYEGSEDEDNLTLIDRLAEDDHQDELIDGICLKNLLNELEDREKQIIILRYYRDKTQSEIARTIGVSQVQVSRLENKILEKLRKKML